MEGFGEGPVHRGVSVWRGWSFVISGQKREKRKEAPAVHNYKHGNKKVALETAMDDQVMEKAMAEFTGDWYSPGDTTESYEGIGAVETRAGLSLGFGIGTFVGEGPCKPRGCSRDRGDVLEQEIGGGLSGEEACNLGPYISHYVLLASCLEE